MRERWNELLYVKTKPGTINLLHNYTVISEKEMLYMKFGKKQMTKMYNAAKKMYVATRCSLGCKPKHAM